MFNPSEWNIGIYCTQGRNISRGRRPRKIFSTKGTIICRYFTRKGFEYLVYYIGYSLWGTTVSVATYPLTMRSIRGGTFGWNIEIYSTPTNQFDWSVSRAYVINIYMETTADHFTPLALHMRGKVTVVVPIYIYYVCGWKKYLNHTLEIDSPFQTFAVPNNLRLIISF